MLERELRRGESLLITKDEAMKISKKAQLEELSEDERKIKDFLISVEDLIIKEAQKGFLEVVIPLKSILFFNEEKALLKIENEIRSSGFQVSVFEDFCNGEELIISWKE